MWGRLLGTAPVAAPVEWRYDDLPTPISDAEMMTTLQEQIEVRNQWIKGTEKDGWELYMAENGITVDQLLLPDSAIHVVRSRGTLRNIDIEKLFKAFNTGGIEEKRKLSPEILVHQKLHEIAGHPEIYISYSVFSAPIGVSNREFLYLRDLVKHDDGSFLIISQSINYEKKPFDVNNVRGSLRNVRLFEPMEKEGDYRITLVDHLNPRGNVPGFVVNLFKKKALEALLKMQAVYGKTQ